MSEKLKLYLDTSVISHLDQPDKDIEYRYTHEFWDRAKAGEYDIYISAGVIDEIKKCDEVKKQILLDYLDEIYFNEIEITPEISIIADSIIEREILTKKSIEDCRHIAAAVVGECDYLLSWNMKHLCNIFTNDGVRHITMDYGYKELQIIPPSMLLRK
ncbi:MAG: PIN domain nuclease [Ruminococcus sp.]|nr:PIN domain nuclease [Ruminococcus sp.]